ncbi:MAG: TonB-dependent receptor, partial [Alistipes sp.]|nr:TonB-dependent receptor [Alistipes sp.]
LLPGGKTVNPNLMKDNPFSLRDGGVSQGNASFGTAVEVDGVRLSTNASFGEMSGASTRNIASSNVESIEVITGIPSVEYGDLTSGIVKVKTSRGRTPYTATFSTNPKTKQFSLSKGFDLGENRGSLNIALEHTRAIDNPTSPYTSYQRNGLMMNYAKTFNKERTPLNFAVGFTGNLGGMNTKNDPDALTGEWSKAHDNALRLNTSLDWLFNKPWITNLELSGAINYADQLSRHRLPVHTAAEQPAVNGTEEGYFLATSLPMNYINTQYIDSKELDYNLSAKANWARRFGKLFNRVKLGLVWNADGNVGKGEYYQNATLLPNGYRPRPYTDIPYMHNLALYLEENLTMPLGSTSLAVMAGVRGEKTIIKNSNYKNAQSLSPRFNVKYTLVDRAAKHFLSQLSIRGGWGITEKLPSFNILYPDPQYRDIQVFGASFGEHSAYVYHTTPYSILYNDQLKWTRNRNIELGLDMTLGGTRISLSGYFNRTKYPYRLSNSYTPFDYRISQMPSDFTMPANPEIVVDSQTGNVFVGDKENPGAGIVMMDTKVMDRTFVKNTYQDNGSPIDRRGLELTVDFPQIRAIRTQFRFDAAYTHVKYVNEGLNYMYKENQSHSSIPGRSFEYVGIYVDNGNSQTATYNGNKTQRLDANLTAITHIPSIRLIVSVRLEASLYSRSQNISSYHGQQLAYNVTVEGESYTELRPLYYMDLKGDIYPYDDAAANDPVLKGLIIRGNDYQLKEDGYDPYFAANLSITKEIGRIASLSFYANNFTNARRYLASYASGVKVILTPDFYYGLTLRLKF